MSAGRGGQVHPSGRRAAWVLLGLLAVCAAALLLALCSGSSEVGLAQLPSLLFWPDDSAGAEILHRLRLPRAMAALTTGALLALSGALMQILLRNPLADPYVLGLSGTAAFGALLMLALGCGVWLVNLGAFVGAWVAVVGVFFLGGEGLRQLAADQRAEASPRLLLTGVMFSAIAMAGVSLVLTLAPSDQLRGMLFWMMGDLSGVELSGWVLGLPWALCLLLAPWGRDLNLLLRGAGAAQILGVPVRPLRGLIYLVASSAAAVAVTTAGTIGFVGLVVPHALRLLIGNDQRLLLPASALAGGAFLLLADTLARSVAAPMQLPVGVITALIGAPVFIALLVRQKVAG